MCGKFEKIKLLALVWLTTLCVLIGCNGKSSSKFEGEKMKVSIAVPNTSPNWLTIIALERGFFAENGLDVAAENYPSGKRALLAMFDGKVDIAPVSKVPVVFNSFKRDDFAVISVIGATNNDNKIVARKDAGISKPSDLKNKRIATQKASASHFFLHLMMLKNNILDRETTLSYFKIEDLPNALFDGKVDAISTREPFLSKAINLLKDNAITFEEPGLYNKSFVLTGMKVFIENNPIIIRRIIRSMLDAKDFAKKHPGQASKLISRRLKLPEAYIAEAMKCLRLDIKLDQALLYGLEDISRWAINNKLVAGLECPDFLKLTHIESLKKEDNKLVTLIH